MPHGQFDILAFEVARSLRRRGLGRTAPCAIRQQFPEQRLTASEAPWGFYADGRVLTGGGGASVALTTSSTGSARTLDNLDVLAKVTT